MSGGSPFKATASIYIDLGWSPIPLPARAKDPVPGPGREGGGERSVTGGDGEYVTEAVLRARGWLGSKGRARAGNLIYPPWNIALRLPKDVIGIDVDAYGTKAGRATLAAAEKAWGLLPETWSSCNRPVDAVSGIRLFRLPASALGLAWPGKLPQGEGVELIRWDHRYVVCAPSEHPDGRRYFWRDPGGETVDLSDSDIPPDWEIDLPAVADLPWFPETWIEGLTAGRVWSGISLGEGAELTAGETRDWLLATTGGADGKPCALLARTLKHWTEQVRTCGDDGGAHDAARDGAWALIGDAAEGHSGVSVALARLRRVFLTAVRGRREDGAAKAEWARIVQRGVSKVVAEGQAAGWDGEPGWDSDPCDKKKSGLSAGGSGGGSGGRAGGGNAGGPGGGREGSSGKHARDGLAASGATATGSGAYDWARDDIGNAQRLHRRLSADALYVPGLGGWHTWCEESSRWRLDDGGIQMLRWAMQSVRDMEAEAEYIEDEKQRVDFLRFVRGSGAVGKLKASVEALRSLEGMHARAEVFDRDIRSMLCANGVIEFYTRSQLISGDGGLTAPALGFRPARRSDRYTMSTGTKYVPGARHDLWDNFLKAAMPDAEVRDWVQKAVGYSLFGINHARLFFIVQGLTSSGKSTFTESIRCALGDYAATFELSLFRAEREQGPNVQKVRLLPKRIAISSEASEDRRLDADEIKRVIGGEAISGRLNNSNEIIERVPAFTPWFSSNDPPLIPGADAALWRRMWAIPFDQTLPKSEENDEYATMLRDLPECREAVLAWAAAGWEGYVKEGLDDAPAAIVQRTMKMRGELSDLDIWLGSETESGPGGPESEYRVASGDLYQSYRLWCEESGSRAVSMVAFGRALGRRGYENTFIRSGVRSADKKVRGWLGIRIKSD